LFSPGSSGVEANFSATIASNAQSVSGGTYTDNGTFCGFEPARTTGTFTGYVVTPLNGTFAGTLTGGSKGPDQITIQVTQDSNFGITATGSSLQTGLTTSLSISPAGSSTDNTDGYSNVIGATVQASGTSSNVNGNSTFQVFGHIRDFVVREMPRQRSPISPLGIANVTGLNLRKVSVILSDLERNLLHP